VEHINSSHGEYEEGREMVTGVNIRGDTKINSSFVALATGESFAAAELVMLVSLTQLFRLCLRITIYLPLCSSSGATPTSSLSKV
jgi:hypothetical protein